MMMSLPPHLLDAGVVLTFAVLGLAAMFVGYRLGGRAWQDRFVMWLPQSDGSLRHKPGQHAEIAMLGLSVIVLLGVNRLTPDVRLLDLFQDYGWGVASAVVCVFAGTALHGLAVCRKAERGEGRDRAYVAELRRGYWFYDVYSTVNFTFLGLIVLLIVLQFGVDIGRAAQQHRDVRALLDGLTTIRGGTEAAQTVVEAIYGGVLRGTSYAVDQLNTALLVLFVTLGVGFVLNVTPLGRVYERDAVRMSNLATLTAFGVVLLMAWFVYFDSYAALIDEAVNRLGDAGMSALMNAGPWEVTQRYYAVLLDLTQRRGFGGFLIAVATERGSLVLLLGALQVAFSLRRDLLGGGAEREAATRRRGAGR